MKAYNTKGRYKEREINHVVVENEYPDSVKLELMAKKSNFDEVGYGQEYYDKVDVIKYKDKEGYVAMLYGKRDGTTARKYISKLGLKIIGVVI